MNCIEKMLTRRSIRKFKNEPVSEEVMNNILEAGRRSPSATNKQPWHFVIARDHKEKEAFSFGGFNRFTSDAAFVVLGLYKQSEVIIAESFGSIYERNAINSAMPILISEDITSKINDKDIISVDFTTGEIINITRGKTYQTKPFSKPQLEIYKRGGLLIQL